MSITIAALDFDALEEAQLIALVRGVLSDISDSTRADASHEAEWVETSEQKTWAFPCYLIKLGSRVVMWSNTDEAGVQDVTVADAEDGLDAQIEEWAVDLAAEFGDPPGPSDH